MVCHQIRLRGHDNFFFLAEKKRTRNHPFAYVDVHISCKMMRNVIARPFLATNSLGDVSLGKEKSSIATMNLLAQKIWSSNFFLNCYHAGGRNGESSPCDALTPKKGETRFEGKMRTYLWVCLLTPTPNPIFPPLVFVK